jgi:hypothetical protein
LSIFDMHITWNKTGDQATVSAEIAEVTLQAVTAFFDPGQDGYHDTHPASDDPAPMWDPANTASRYPVAHRAPMAPMRLGQEELKVTMGQVG